jgi:RND family efflux transporter MFP subunit
MSSSPWCHIPAASSRQQDSNCASTILLACALPFLATLTACSRSDAPPMPEALPAIPVSVVTVEEGVHHSQEEIVGTVRAKLRASIQPRISGRIEQFHAVPGQSVEPGDLLVELDTREMRARLEQSVALRQQAGQDLARFQALLDQEAITRSEFDNVQARFAVAQAAVTEAETMLDHTRIIAPFHGIVTRKLADVGDLAHPERALLELEDPRLLRFEAHVPESLFARIELGADLPVRLPAPGLELSGRVTEIAPVADPASRTSLITLDLPPTPGLRSGLFGRLLVPTAERSALRVPATAVLQRGQMELLFVVQDDRAHLRLVRTGKRWQDEVELVSGIRAGETIVATGAEALRDGQPVTVTP